MSRTTQVVTATELFMTISLARKVAREYPDGYRNWISSQLSEGRGGRVHGAGRGTWSLLGW